MYCGFTLKFTAGEATKDIPYTIGVHQGCPGFFGDYLGREFTSTSQILIVPTEDAGMARMGNFFGF
eukprot:1494887-Ditylum_brightwellii.AAC.1